MQTSKHSQFIYIFNLTITTAICIISFDCSPAYEEIEIVYQAEDGQRITAVYHNPTNDVDKFSVTLEIPRGQPITLNQGAAASGVRYTDDKTLVWWTKSNVAFMMKPDGKGDWQITDRYKEILLDQNR
ncbi:MliC family protein [Leptospira terpstrae]|uniref:Membrane-bound lysozyme-inhibitor of C-type lysozyme n=1 Tax=Leptospira terpstrae serovar Hualin str. LT 11-33 = ATCC 700639 TaxID=1257025 RepID=N1VT69_9LEPT|nr:MliC family protein [Leptospira terpstrae]EMY62914.1 membrane-bound lysozyme-inhibitor of C-type lysozyme [Leptospira terpstrae serovar Hualin str. LT 11-33 = ATCC 700639]